MANCGHEMFRRIGLFWVSLRFPTKLGLLLLRRVEQSPAIAQMQSIRFLLNFDFVETCCTPTLKHKLFLCCQSKMITELRVVLRIDLWFDKVQWVSF